MTSELTYTVPGKVRDTGSWLTVTVCEAPAFVVSVDSSCPAHFSLAEEGVNFSGSVLLPLARPDPSS